MIFNYEKALSRIKEIDWGSLGGKDNQTLLINEYLIRASAFLVDHGVESSMPIFNPASVAKVDLLVPDRLAEDLDSVLDGNATPFVKLICKSYLTWALLCELDPERFLKYKGLYGPILYYFEQGGTVSLGRNELQVGSYSIPLHNWMGLQKTFEFDSEVQEKIDID